MSWQLLYHVNFGRPLLDLGSTVIVPAKTIVPREKNAAANVASWNHFVAEQPGAPENVYLFDLAAGKTGRTEVLLKNAHSTEGVSVRFNREQLPCFTLWKNTPAAVDGYVTGLEPGTNYPNPRTHETEQDRVVELAPGASQAFDLEIDWHQDARQVAAAESAVKALQGGIKLRVFDEPQPGWCAGLWLKPIESAKFNRDK